MTRLELPWPPSMNHTPCIDGPGERTRLGYVRSWNGGDRKLVHVEAWEEKNGPVPDGMELDHKCRNRWCRNADHIEAVTHAVNCQRRITTKLDWAKVREIRKRYARGDGLVPLAMEYGVTKQNIKRVVLLQTWKEAP